MRWFVYQVIPGMHELEWTMPVGSSAPEGLDKLLRCFTKAFKKGVSDTRISYNPFSGTPYFLLQVGEELYIASDLPMKVLGEISASEIWL